MKETSLDLPGILNEQSSVRSMEGICCSGKGLDLNQKRMSSLDPVASNADNNEKSCHLSACETPSRIRSVKSRCSTGDDGENSSDSIASDTLCSRNPSNQVTLKTQNEIKSAEERRPTEKDGFLEDIGENSSNSVTSATVIRCTETECFASENGVPKAKTDFKGNEILNDPDSMSGPCVVIDMEEDEGRFHNVSLDGEEICRICHLSSEHQPDVADFIKLGCSCKGELGTAHRLCAEAWFKRKGNRQCEICGQCAKNLTEVRENRFVGWWWIDRGTMETDRRTRETDRELMETDDSLSSESSRCWRLQPVCNFLFVCLLLAFIIPWAYRMNTF